MDVVGHSGCRLARYDRRFDRWFGKRNIYNHSSCNSKQLNSSVIVDVELQDTFIVLAGGSVRGIYTVVRVAIANN